MNTESSDLITELLAEVKRQGRILDELVALLPAMKKAATFLENPATNFRNAVKPWRKTSE